MDILGYEWTWKGGFAGGLFALALVLGYRNRMRFRFFLEFIFDFASSLFNIEKVHALLRKRSLDARANENSAINVISRIQAEFTKKTREFDAYVAKAWDHLKAVKLNDLMGLEQARKDFRNWENVERDRVHRELDIEREKARKELALRREEIAREISLTRQEVERERLEVAARRDDVRGFFIKLSEDFVNEHKKNAGELPWKKQVIDYFEEELVIISRERKILENETENISRYRRMSDEECKRLLDETNREIQRRRDDLKNQVELMNRQKEDILRDIDRAREAFAKEKARETEALKQHCEKEYAEIGKRKSDLEDQIKKNKDAFIKELEELEKNKREFQDYQKSEAGRIRELNQASITDSESIKTLKEEIKKVGRENNDLREEVGNLSREKTKLISTRLGDQEIITNLRGLLNQSRCDLMSWQDSMKKIHSHLDNVDICLKDPLPNMKLQDILNKIKKLTDSIRLLIPVSPEPTNVQSVPFFLTSRSYSEWDPQGHLSQQWHD